MIKITEDWDGILKEEFESASYKKLREFLKAEYFSRKIYPPMHDIFNSMKITPFNDIKVVIIGQDPYHEPGQAHGLCFSVLPPTPNPPSLQNIYKEIESDLHRPSVTNGDLTYWATQGVLLLNSTLTVQAHLAASHSNRGWEQFTDAVIRALNTRENIVYMLWGSFAQKKAAIVDSNKNLILKSAHPSPLSAYRGFFGNHHFSLANEYLTQHNKTPIEW